MNGKQLTLDEVEGLAHQVLYLPIYAEHLRCGKVDGRTVPVVTQPRPASIWLDAGHGFAHARLMPVGLRSPMRPGFAGWRR